MFKIRQSIINIEIIILQIKARRKNCNLNKWQIRYIFSVISICNKKSIIMTIEKSMMSKKEMYKNKVSLKPNL